MNCLNCGIELVDKREGAKFCSPKCRVNYSRKNSVIVPMSRKAHDAVLRAVKTGKLTPQPCKVCGQEPTDAHHAKGYGQENWLNVTWLCRSHHKLEHHVTDNVTFKEPDVTDNFEFTADSYDLNLSNSKREVLETNKRTAKYWYDVPLGAKPIIKQGWPKMPDFMNGRQYFLWWKNNFEEGEKGPVILGPYPKHEGVYYQLAGEGSRRLGS